GRHRLLRLQTIFHDFTSRERATLRARRASAGAGTLTITSGRWSPGLARPSGLRAARHAPEDAGHGGEEHQAEDLVAARAQGARQRVLARDLLERVCRAVEGAQHCDDDAGD